MTFAVTLSIAGAALASGPFFQEAQEPPPTETVTEDTAAPVVVAPAPSYQVEVRELFRSTGAEPAFWAAYSRSDFERAPLDSGVVDFRFDLKEIATVLGTEPETQFMVESGADRLTVTQDSETRLVRLGTDSPITSYVNARVATLEAWSDRHQQMMTPFDGSIVPSLVAGELELTCIAEDLIVDDTAYLLTTYQASDHAFQIGATQALMSYRGLAVLDPASGQVFHSVFEQKGTVTNGEKVSQVDHQVVMTLLDAAQGGELALILPGRVQDRVNSYRFSTRTDESPLDPTLETNEVRPEWSVDLWLSGRVAEMTMGMIAEQGTNPLPVSALGGLALSDQAISYGGTQLVEQRKIDMGEDDPNAPKIDRVQSPLERAYGPAPFGERLALLGPETTGVLKIENEEPVAIGALFLLTTEVFGSGAQGSRLAFATGGASGGSPVWDVVSSSSGTGVSSYVPLALLLIGGGVAIAESGGGGTTPPVIDTVVTLRLDEALIGGCYRGRFELEIIDGQPGRLWQLEGNGTILGSATCTASGSWAEVDSRVSTNTQQFVLQIPVPDNGCLDATVTVTADGAPHEFTILGLQVPSGSISNPCF